MIAFALNYIPFIGPFIASVSPTLLAMAQFATWQAPSGVRLPKRHPVRHRRLCRAADLGNILSISPSVVLFAVFFWTFLWGLYGAFIGVRSPSPS